MLITVLQALLPPVILFVSLYFTAQSYDIPFDEPFQVLAIIAVTIGIVLLRPSGSMTEHLLAPRIPLAAGIVIRWFALLGILLAIGYSTKLSAQFSRRVVLTWVVVTPALLILTTLILREFSRRVLMHPSNARSVVFAGCNDVSVSLSDRILKNSELCMKVQGFFDQLVERTVPVSGTREAELTKLLENTFRHVNIALVNELAMFAKDLGIDVWEAIDAASTKPFGFMRFTPGPGVGGHCLPIDPSYLSWQIERRLGQTFRFVELANDVNSHMPDYVVRRVQFLLNEASRSVKGSRILVFGLSYKANTGDARETPSVPICELLVGLGADVHVVDPHVDDRQFPAGVVRAEGTDDDLAAADLVLFLVDHNEFDGARIVERAGHVLDCRHALTGDNVDHL